MNFEEYAAKAEVLVPASVPVPRGKLCATRGRGRVGLRRKSDPAWSRRRCRPANAAKPAASQGRQRRRKPNPWRRPILGMSIDGL